MKPFIILVVIVGIIALAYFGLGNSSLQITQPTTARATPDGVFTNPLAVTSCTPQAPYTHCIENTYSGDGATATVKLYTINALKDINKEKSGYYVGDVKFPAMVLPANSKLYYTVSASSWNSIFDQCGGSGCSGNLVTSPSVKTLATVGQEFKGCPVYYAWTRADSADGYAWTGVGYGWIGTGNCISVKSVACYDNNDCSSNQVCNKKGTWQTWACEAKICDEGKNKCEGQTPFICSQNKWSQQSIKIGSCGVECNNDENKCEGTESFVCTDRTWKSNGVVGGECGVSSNFIVRTWQIIKLWFTSFFDR